MDRENLWTRRTTTIRTNTSHTLDRDNKNDSHSRHYPPLKQRAGSETPTRAALPNGASPLNTNITVAPGASSAFALGHGAFASFGASAKTPIKTPGSAVDLSKSSLTTPTSTDPLKPISRQPTSVAQASTRVQSASSSESKASYPLKHSWVMWYRPPTSKNSDYEKSIKPLYKMSTAQEFWKIYAHMKRPSALPTVSDYHFFKEGIRPVWEDEENKKGGKWIMRLKKGVMDRYWDDMLLAVVGDQFAEAGEEVCGMVVSVRSGEDVLSVWTKNDGGRNIKIRETMKRVLSLPADTVVIWKSHDDSIAQRSAIDQARQDKGVPEKRRNGENVKP